MTPSLCLQEEKEKMMTKTWNREFNSKDDYGDFDFLLSGSAIAS
jgi:hypothetical protein